MASRSQSCKERRGHPANYHSVRQPENRGPASDLLDNFFPAGSSDLPLFLRGPTGGSNSATICTAGDPEAMQAMPQVHTARTILRDAEMASCKAADKTYTQQWREDVSKGGSWPRRQKEPAHRVDALASSSSMVVVIRKFVGTIRELLSETSASCNSSSKMMDKPIHFHGSPHGWPRTTPRRSISIFGSSLTYQKRGYRPTSARTRCAALRQTNLPGNSFKNHCGGEACPTHLQRGAAIEHR